MIPADDVDCVAPKGETVMKKLMSLMLGLTFALGTVAMFADDTTPTTDKKMTSKKKTTKKKSKSTSTTDAPKAQ
jgi:hypothetical protein